MSSTLRACLQQECGLVGIDLSESQVALALAHAAALLEWNATTNLTRIVEPRALVRRHFVESLLAARLLPPAPATGPGPSVVDVGSGGGFPGLALRVLRPDVRLTLLEPRQRKAAFLRHVAALQPPPIPEVVARPVQEVKDLQAHDVATLRGVKVPIPALLRLLVPRRGLVVLFPGRDGESELLSGLVTRGWRVRERIPLPDEGRQVISVQAR